MQPNTPTAAIIVIGNEILSGRTQDKNVQFIAKNLSDKGIFLAEVRIIPDISEIIGSTARYMSENYDYVFTSGGIGPTHDDITTHSLGAAFGCVVERNEEAYNLLVQYYASKGRVLNEASARMAEIPQNCPLIYNSASGAPGFIINGNIYVLAGVPYILQAMFLSILPSLEAENAFVSKTIRVLVGESTVALSLETVQNKYPTVNMGSYPGLTDDGAHMTSLVLRSNDHDSLNHAFLELSEAVKQHPKLDA